MVDWTGSLVKMIRNYFYNIVLQYSIIWNGRGYQSPTIDKGGKDQMTDPKSTQDIAVPPLKGCYNFRDLGGHKSILGAMIRTGAIFRSGNIASATHDDVKYFHSLGLAAVCDFRSGPEYAASPNQWIVQTNIDYWRWGDNISTGDSAELLRECCFSSTKTIQRMQEVYRQIPYEQANSLRELFHRLGAGKTPLLFHCAAGKDRTGVAAALILSMLGVNRADIFADFMLTNRFFQQIYQRFLSDPRHNEITAMAANTEEPWLPMMRAEPAYLDAMFAQIEQEHGGVLRYLEDVVGVTPETQSKIREHLLEDRP